MTKQKATPRQLCWRTIRRSRCRSSVHRSDQRKRRRPSKPQRTAQTFRRSPFTVRSRTTHDRRRLCTHQSPDALGSPLGTRLTGCGLRSPILGRNAVSRPASGRNEHTLGGLDPDVIAAGDASHGEVEAIEHPANKSDPVGHKLHRVSRHARRLRVIDGRADADQRHGCQNKGITVCALPSPAHLSMAVTFSPEPFVPFDVFIMSEHSCAERESRSKCSL
jgi:hypothetical protein